MGSEGIKPGDVVRHAWMGVGVAILVNDGHLVTMLADDFRPWDVGPATGLELLAAGTADDERTVTTWTATSRLIADPYRLLARKEALARGWRPLDREDVTEDVLHVAVRIGNERIGEVSRMLPALWNWALTSDHISGNTDSKDAAVDALIAAENARRAQEQP